MDRERGGPLAGCRISYLFMPVLDFPAMLGFYRDILGFEVVYIEEDRIAFLRLPGDAGPQIAIYPGREMRGEGDGRGFVAVDVTGIDDVVARLRASGVRIDSIEDVPYGRAAKFEDPDGNVLEVHEPTGW